MECEQRGLLNHEIEFLRGLETTVNNHDADMGFSAATKHVAAIRLANMNDIL